MIKKINLYSVYGMLRSNIFIIFAFLAMSLLSGLLLLKHGFVFPAGDITFHWSRISEIHQSIINGNGIPKVAVNRFYQSGSAVMTMYPNVNLWFIVLLSFFIKSYYQLIYVIFILRNLLSLLVAFFSCYSFSKRKSVAVLFSIAYTFTPMIIRYAFFNTDLGASTSIIFLPLVLFGTFELLNDNKWKELALGLSFIIISHVITSVLSLLLVAIMICINYKKIKNISFMYSLFKCSFVVILITSIFWIPFSIMVINNHIAMPNTQWNLSGVDINELISEATNPYSVYFPDIDLISFVGLLLSVINYKRMTLYSKQIFWISVVLMIISTKLFPWDILNSTFVRTTFQRPYRLYVIVQVLSCYLLSENCIKYCKKIKDISILLITFSLCIICVQISEQKSLNDTSQNNLYSFNDVFDNNKGLITDYFTAKSLKIQNDISSHQITYGKKKGLVKLLGNGKFSFVLDKSTKSLKMPFLIYNDINYQVKADGKNSKFNSDNHSQLTLGHMNKGKHTVQVIVHKSWYDYLSYVLSALGVIILAFAWIRSLILKRKNKE